MLFLKNLKKEKIYYRILNFYKIFIINSILVIVILLNHNAVLSENINLENLLALKYCDSLERKLFDGLENERVLKYKYFFNTINFNIFKNNFNIDRFANEVEYLCNYKLNLKERDDFNLLLELYFSNKN